MPIYILQAIILNSFFSSALTFLLYPKQTYSHHRILFQQILYVVLVMCMIMTTIIIVSGEISLLSFIVNFLVVMALFFLIKYLLYKKDKATAAEINELLQQRKKRTTS
jgi:Ca2+/Na+ antiporter